ncbi:receptor-like protein EIX2 [Nicotiana tomentosiformis]|uniref:receptor-like protein EIX2 n=1 Tax=Nicotiana tomentosiformis TaxID=4098 RepID=UPI00051AB819|nr:receptor-like protein EIX2 [Nicotiana tomentosiformis]
MSKKRLERLKKEVYDPTFILSSWVVGKDCCEWEGVVCHNLTRHVIELHMHGHFYEHTDLRINSLIPWLPSLLNLENLEMDYVDLRKATNWLQIINNLPSLLHLSLSECVIPNKVGNVTKLNFLDLAFNNLNSTIPNWLYGCKKLESLSLGHNHLEGVVSSLISNLSSITNIDLSDNMLSGKLPNVNGKLRKLEYLYFSQNLFEEEVSEFFNGLGNRSALRYLTLRDNELTGNLPESLGSLSMLESLYIFNNRLEGVVTESNFTNLTQLRYFYASTNSLTLKVSRNWIPPFQAINFVIGGWNIGPPHFPMWIQTQKQIVNLDISNGGIQSEVTTWFWNLASQITFLNLSHNKFVGEVPIVSASSWSSGQGPWIMYLSSNNFSGLLPRISTIELDLSNNSFSEELIVLILRDNNLIGGISKSLEVLSNLQSLDFRRNRLNGSFSSSLKNCTKLHKIDLAENVLVGQLPSWLGTRFPKLIILSLRSNKFDGVLPQELCYLKDLQILDLANNAFVGIIPRCISNFSAMVKGRTVLEDGDELSYSYYVGVVRESAMVTTKGNMYRYDTILALFTSMNMSNNNLSGEIPASFTSLVGLRSFNFSKNHFSGRIPNGIGNMTVLESVDLSEN